MSNRLIRTGTVLLAMAATGLLLPAAQAVMPEVKTVPWVAGNPLIPHSTYSGRSVTLKGTSSVSGTNFEYVWDFGDGSSIVTGNVSNAYVVEAIHAYTGAVGEVFTARLTVRDKTTGEAAGKEYYVQIQEQKLETEANIAIDEGLWYLHKAQRRYSSGGIDYGDWTSCLFGCYANSSFYGVTATNVTAFEVNGHLEGGLASNPYTETVQRGMRRIFTMLNYSAIGPQTPFSLPTFNPDTNGNGIGVAVAQSYAFYQGGMFMDAIYASGTPTAIAMSGGLNILGRQYRDILQDMADFYGYCQHDGTTGGAWRYDCNQGPDNSASQWAAIGLIPVERDRAIMDPAKKWFISVPETVKLANIRWLKYSQDPGSGAFGYDAPYYYPWGAYALIGSGMVQMAMDGIGRGGTDPNKPNWDKAETFIRDRFGNSGGPTVAIKDYYYGLFSFTKAMLLHDASGDGIAEPIKLLQSATAGVAPLDWYAAEVSKGDPTDGVARTLVNDQVKSGTNWGYWYGNDYSSDQYRFETAWAVIMLNRTVFASGVPVAVAQAIPNPGVAGQTITLDGSSSFHQDPLKSIDSWQWDLNSDGVWDVSGPSVTTSFPALGDYLVRLRVTDNATPEDEDETSITVRITIPPIAPTANANGPYNFCPGRTPWYLDGAGSINPDDGQSEPGLPGDFLKEYAWDLDGDNDFNDSFGAAPNVTDYFLAKAAGSYLVKLRVSDNTSISFPSSNLPDLTSSASAQVNRRAADDAVCMNCVNNLAARPKSGKVQLTWLHVGANHYNVYRGTISGGPYLKIGSTTSEYSTYLDASVVNGTTYYYVVRTAELNDNELCQSNEARATPLLR